ncbi:hypothetical protein DEO72_LG7g1018 [Vigna unguiculata]|uniref:Uncharacterized protein n=1 Tax=Vigna unguiculata TaxID=3917 RepID=A0A4D6MG10_VIGUN|nr:hypothetical protein DEO72_LG7g1018 [Vigna unguiculata]
MVIDPPVCVPRQAVWKHIAPSGSKAAPGDNAKNVSLELWLGIGVKHVTFPELWLGIASLELWLGMADEHEELLSCGSGIDMGKRMNLPLSMPMIVTDKKVCVPRQAVWKHIAPSGSKAAPGDNAKNVSLELWLGIGVKHVTFPELWLGIASLELWLGMADEHEELLSCGSGWRVFPIVWSIVWFPTRALQVVAGRCGSKTS